MGRVEGALAYLASFCFCWFLKFPVSFPSSLFCDVSRGDQISPRNTLSLPQKHSSLRQTLLVPTHFQALTVQLGTVCSSLCPVTWLFPLTFWGRPVLPLSPLLLFSLSSPAVHTHRPVVLVRRVCWSWSTFGKKFPSANR